MFYRYFEPLLINLLQYCEIFYFANFFSTLAYTNNAVYVNYAK